MDWDYILLRKEYRIGDVDSTARRACRHFRMDGDAIVPSFVAAVMMSDGKPFNPMVDPNESVEAESVEDAVDRFISNLPDGEVLARRIIRKLDHEADKKKHLDERIPSVLAYVPDDATPAA